MRATTTLNNNKIEASYLKLKKGATEITKLVQPNNMNRQKNSVICIEANIAIYCV